MGLAMAAAAGLGHQVTVQDQPRALDGRDGTRLQVAMLVYQDMILLDLVAPQTVLTLLGAQIHLVGKDRAPVRTDDGVPVWPTSSFSKCPERVDILFVPGCIIGSVAAMDDPETMHFVTTCGGSARYVTSVCTGSLLLAAAGLLRGYRATSHWYVRDLLPRLGAIEVAERVVIDRNRVTAVGVTAGMDFALSLAEAVADRDAARRIQLVLEYDPHPPFAAGSPTSAGTDLVDRVLMLRAPAISAASAAAERARSRLAL
jgi:cyclohexyl-isocyanide hydratase